MPPENYFITTLTPISMEEIKNIFPWFENLTDEILAQAVLSPWVEEAHRAPQCEVEMKQA